jgi:hypothetical protein
MNKFLNKWFRQIHRWIAIPTALLIPVAVIIKLVGSAEATAFWEKWDKLPSIFMLFMAITGSYLYLLPYIAKGRKKRSRMPVADGQAAE